MESFTPANLVHKIFEPESGTAEDLSPVIFLHGLVETKEVWKDAPEIIANKTKRKTYSLDFRNHGDSPWYDDENFDFYSEDLLHFMDLKSIPKAVFIGLSMGGFACIQIALRKPERVQMLFLTEITVTRVSKPILNSLADSFSLYTDAVKDIPSDCKEAAVNEHIMKYIYSTMTSDFQKARARESMANQKFPLKRDETGRYALKANTIQIIEALRHKDVAENKGVYEGPAFFIYGTKSAFKVDKDEDRIKNHFPKAELIPFEGSGHTVYTESPDKFIEVVLQRLQNAQEIGNEMAQDRVE